MASGLLTLLSMAEKDHRSVGAGAAPGVGDPSSWGRAWAVGQSAALGTAGCLWVTASVPF